MIEEAGWKLLSFNFTVNGLQFLKESGTLDYEIDNCTYEPDPECSEPQILLILLHLGNLAKRENAPDRKIAIGEHAFRAGWKACTDAVFSPDTSVTQTADKAWSEYTPPEELCGGGAA